MVIIILGSEKDLEWGDKIKMNLKIFGIESKVRIASAHKSPEYLINLLKEYSMSDRPQVYICVAGRSNALGGFVDANCALPVINCPPPSEKFGRRDIFSSLRMPSGVASLTVLEADQAALAAAKIISLKDSDVRKKVIEYQKVSREKIIAADKKINSL